MHTLLSVQNTNNWLKKQGLKQTALDSFPMDQISP